jgi:hypothetical protein
LRCESIDELSHDVVDDPARDDLKVVQLAYQNEEVQGLFAGVVVVSGVGAHGHRSE